MAIPSRVEHLRLVHPTVGTLILASRGINAHGYSSLRRRGSKRKDQTELDGVAGEVAHTLVTGSVRELVSVRIDGSWVHATDIATAGDNREQAYANFDLVDAHAAVNDLDHTIELHRAAGIVTARVQVLDWDIDREPAPWLWDCTLDVLLPDGPLR